VSARACERANEREEIDWLALTNPSLAQSITVCNDHVVAAESSAQPRIRIRSALKCRGIDSDEIQPPQKRATPRNKARNKRAQQTSDEHATQQTSDATQQGLLSLNPTQHTYTIHLTPFSLRPAERPPSSPSILLASACAVSCTTNLST